MEQTISNLKSNSLKITPQRLAIYTYLLHTTSHPTAQSIYQQIKKDYPSVSFATVYKTLNILRDADLILEFNVGGDSFRYDANTEAHPHFICKSCQEVYDLHKYSGYDTIAKSLEASNPGFKIDKTDLYLYGTCDKCNN